MKKVLISLFIFIVIIFLLDICSSYVDYKSIDDYRKSLAFENGFETDTFDNFKNNFNYSLRLMPFKDYFKKEFKRGGVADSRNVDKEHEKNDSVIIFGCSYAEGSFLDLDDKPANVLAEITKMPVYNRAWGGLGLATMLWQTRSQEFWDGIKYPPKYIIHVFIPYHVGRLLTDKYGMSSLLPIYIGYNVKDNNTLVENKLPFRFLFRFKFIRKIVYGYQDRKFNTPENQDFIFDLIKLHYIESKKAIMEKYPNVKFIIIKHPISKEMIMYDYDYIYNTERWKELETEGFIVYDLAKDLNIDITTKEYLLPDMHPNKKTWQVVIPKLVKDLDIK